MIDMWYFGRAKMCCKNLQVRPTVRCVNELPYLAVRSAVAGWPLVIDGGSGVPAQE